MCGRYVRRADKQHIAEHFRAQADLDAIALPPADFNVAPTTQQPIVRQSRDTGGREMLLARWGLVPFFSKSLADVRGLSTINARGETIATARTWREPFKKRRCLVPVSAFYEWEKFGTAAKKQPYAFEVSKGGLFAFAGLWDAWKDHEGRWLQSYAIVTTAANELMASIHDRMPVILHERDYDRWLDREEMERLPFDLIRPYEAEGMKSYKVNPQVGNVRNNGPEMLIFPAPTGGPELDSA